MGKNKKSFSIDALATAFRVLSFVAVLIIVALSACKKNSDSSSTNSGTTLGNGVVPSTGTWNITVTATGGHVNPGCGTSTATASGTIALVSAGTFSGTMSGTSVTGCVGSMDSSCTNTYCTGNTPSGQFAGIQFCGSVFGSTFDCSADDGSPSGIPTTGGSFTCSAVASCTGSAIFGNNGGTMTMTHQ